jgi:drug/metabolite transporter (DMT)-like permease
MMSATKQTDVFQQAAKRKSLVGLHIANILFGGTGLFAKLINLPAVDIIARRCVLAAVFLLVISFALKRRFMFESIRDGLLMLLCGVLMCVHWVTFFHAMQVSTVAIGMIALYTYPVMSVLVEPLWQGQRPQRIDVLCAFAVLPGVYLLAPDFSLRTGAALGVMWGLVSAAAFTMRNIVQRTYLGSYRGDTAMFYQSLIAGLAAWPFVRHASAGLSTVTWLQLALLALVFTAVPHSIFAGSLRELKAKTAGLISCMMPVYGVALAWVVLGEVPSMATMCGGIIIVAAAAFESIRA